MDIQSIAWSIKTKLVAGNKERETKGVWTTLLAVAFPPQDGFMLNPEFDLPSGRPDILVSRVSVSRRTQRHSFFIVECKPPCRETEGALWETATSQLLRYLRSIADDRRVAGSTNRKFGAIAMGRVVRFYELVDDNMIPLRNGNETYYIDLQCRTVTGLFNYIRQNN